MKPSHIFRKLGCLVEIKFRETNAPMSNARAVQGSAFPPTQVTTFSLTLFTVRISQYKQQASFDIFKRNLIHLLDKLVQVWCIDEYM